MELRDKKMYLALFTCFSTLLIYFILPVEYAIFSVFIPLIALGFIFANSQDKINIYIILILGFALLFIPSNFMLSVMIDTDGGYDQNLPEFIEETGIDNPVWIFQEKFTNAIDIIAAILFIGPPVLFFGFGFYALVKGNPKGGISSLFKALGILLVIGGVFWFLDYVNLIDSSEYAFLETIYWILNIVTIVLMFIPNVIISIIVSVGEFIDQVQNSGLSFWEILGNVGSYFVDLLVDYIVDSVKRSWSNTSEELAQACVGYHHVIWGDLSGNYCNENPSDKFCECNAWDTTKLDATQQLSRLVMIARIYPIALSILCFICYLLFKFDKNMQKWIDQFTKAQSDEYYFEISPKKIDYSILFSLIITLVVSFFVYLGMNDGGYRDPTFFGVYLPIVISCTFIILMRYLPTRDGNISQTITGAILGGAGIFLFTNIFVRRLDVLQTDELNFYSSRLYTTITTMFYTSPAETLLFQTVFPALFLYILIRLNIRTLEKYNSESTLREIALKEKQLLVLRTQYDHAISISANGLKTAQIRTDLFNLDNEIEMLKLKEKAKIQRIEIWGIMTKNVGNIALSIIFIFVIPSFAFAALHFFKSGMSFVDFFAFGPGFVLMSAGCWLIFVTLRWGYNASVSAHSINNLFIYLLTGGII